MAKLLQQVHYYYGDTNTQECESAVYPRAQGNAEIWEGIHLPWLTLTLKFWPEKERKVCGSQERIWGNVVQGLSDLYLSLFRRQATTHAHTCTKRLQEV